MMQPNPGSSGADMTAHDNDVRAVRETLLQLRKRWAMGGERTRAVDTDALLGLIVVRRFAYLTGDDPEVVLPGALRFVAAKLEPAHRFIVDAELSLRMFADRLPSNIVDDLYGADLGKRRECLAQQWVGLHNELGVPIVQRVRSGRALRGRPEDDAFAALARALTLESVIHPSEIPSATPAPTVVVIGDAAWDRIYSVEALPSAGDSLYGKVSVHAGGKGLNRAVALARLGMDARLFAAIGDDEEGSTIVAYLQKRRVDTSLVRSRRGPTPAAAVIVAKDGTSYSIADKADRIRFDARDIADIPITRALVDADAVLLTMEQNDDVLTAVSTTIAEHTPRPWLFVSATPPQPFSTELPEYLEAVDYLIALARELARFRPGTEPADIAMELVKHGVGAVVVLDGGICTMYVADAEPVRVHIQADRPGSPGASSAFVSAFLAAMMARPRPVESDARRDAGYDNLAWAAAAIPARTSKEKSIPDSMPTREAIDRRHDAS
ncbi:hypothetical protein GPX89_35175 [Nocardia sp. ET3-3]|uniref:Carbohydrate kinase PfkB domain-containing protein n=1 Tax=Nocardia terrae TaxID=2675851 RepID=A0A7K1V742_9NOCA|nr:PfkB family carbohydrate kinase [Nocardia terrae]MVU82460.1 hypothetical protein [Nocardia terrae]